MTLRRLALRALALRPAPRGSVNFLSQRYHRAPEAVWAMARERGLMPYRTVTGINTVLVTRHQDALTVLSDARFSVDPRLDRAGVNAHPMGQILAFDQHLLSKDPPEHTRMRRLVENAFTPAYVRSLTPAIERAVIETLDTLPERGTIDFIEHFASPLPIRVIGVLLGFAERKRLRAWGRAVLTLPFDPSPRNTRLVNEFAAYIQNVIQQKRNWPEDDLLSRLVHAHDAEGQLTDRELESLVTLLILAGFETTVNLLGNGLHLLLSAPEQQARLKSDSSLWDNAIEEIVRLAPPVNTSFARFPREDVTLSGLPIRAGTPIFVVLTSANQDLQEVGPAADFDITRQVRKHLSFGFGVHYCLGAPLARLEGQLGLSTFLTRYPAAALVKGAHWRPGMVTHGFERLPVRVAP